jgi:hypothetical protein
MQQSAAPPESAFDAVPVEQLAHWLRVDGPLGLYRFVNGGQGAVAGGWVLLAAAGLRPWVRPGAAGQGAL